jgi:serine/threonine protein kinase
MQVEDEDQQVDDQCGTKGWMAPEVEKKSRHSPIRADRWACGRILLCLLKEFKNEDECLTAFARCHSAYDPKQRPSLIGASSVTPPTLFSDAGNVCSASKRKARPSQDPMEVEENANTKKRREKT